jgi:hypothetical protein
MRLACDPQSRQSRFINNSNVVRGRPIMNLGMSVVYPSCPRKRRAVRGKSCGRIAEQIDPRISSWPGLSRPSRPSSGRNKDVDARIKSAQDELRLISVSQKPVILADIISPDSPARKRESRAPGTQAAAPCSSQGQTLDPRFRGGDRDPLPARAPFSDRRPSCRNGRSAATTRRPTTPSGSFPRSSELLRSVRLGRAGGRAT